MKKYGTLFFGAAILVTGCATKGAPVEDFYRPPNSNKHWNITGEKFGLLNVKVLINGQVVAQGKMKDGPFTSTYDGRTIRTICRVGPIKWSGPADQSCKVYVNGELASNLVFVRGG